MMNTGKRLMNDMAQLQKPEVRDNGIYYWSNEQNVREGKAMIIGPEGTPYDGCPLIFDVTLPADYPLNCPKVLIATSDNQTRFHPNLYVTGKVCLSILGTWKGPGWSPALTLSKVLLSIQSLLEANPIVNEPSFENIAITNPLAKDYAAFVEERLTALTYPALLKFKKGDCPPLWSEFKDVLAEIGDDLIRRQKAKIAAHTEDKEYKTLPYSMKGTTRWLSLAAL